MSTSTLTRPLSDTDRDELHAFLASRPGALDPEALDGLFCALIVGPETVAPGDWIPSPWVSRSWSGMTKRRCGAS